MKHLCFPCTSRTLPCMGLMCIFLQWKRPYSQQGAFCCFGMWVDLHSTGVLCKTAGPALYVMESCDWPDSKVKRLWEPVAQTRNVWVCASSAFIRKCMLSILVYIFKFCVFYYNVENFECPVRYTGVTIFFFSLFKKNLLKRHITPL